MSIHFVSVQQVDSSFKPEKLQCRQSKEDSAKVFYCRVKAESSIYCKAKANSPPPNEPGRGPEPVATGTLCLGFLYTKMTASQTNWNQCTGVISKKVWLSGPVEFRLVPLSVTLNRAKPFFKKVWVSYSYARKSPQSDEAFVFWTSCALALAIASFSESFLAACPVCNTLSDRSPPSLPLLG